MEQLYPTTRQQNHFFFLFCIFTQDKKRCVCLNTETWYANRPEAEKICKFDVSQKNHTVSQISNSISIGDM